MQLPKNFHIVLLLTEFDFFSPFSMSRRLLQQNPSTPSKATTPMQTPSPTTRRYKSSIIFFWLLPFFNIIIYMLLSSFQPKKVAGFWRLHRACCMWSTISSSLHGKGKGKEVEGCLVQEKLEYAEKTWRHYFGAL